MLQQATAPAILAKRDVAALILSCLLGYGTGCLVAVVPRAYAFTWWVAAGSLTYLACALAQHDKTKIGAAMLINGSILLAFLTQGGPQRLAQAFFHAATLTPASQRMLRGEVTGTFMSALICSILIAALITTKVENR